MSATATAAAAPPGRLAGRYISGAGQPGYGWRWLFQPQRNYLLPTPRSMPGATFRFCKATIPLQRSDPGAHHRQPLFCGRPGAFAQQLQMLGPRSWTMKRRISDDGQRHSTAEGARPPGHAANARYTLGVLLPCPGLWTRRQAEPAAAAAGCRSPSPSARTRTGRC